MKSLNIALITLLALTANAANAKTCKTSALKGYWAGVINLTPEHHEYSNQSIALYCKLRISGKGNLYSSSYCKLQGGFTVKLTGKLKQRSSCYTYGNLYAHQSGESKHKVKLKAYGSTKDYSLKGIVYDTELFNVYNLSTHYYDEKRLTVAMPISLTKIK